MQRLSSAICPFCEASRLLAPLRSQWQQSRGAATLVKRKPARMTLSNTVSRSRPEGQVPRKSRNTPFGGMNVTRPPREVAVTRNTISAAEMKRSTRGAPRSKVPQTTSDSMKALRMQQGLSAVSYEQRARIKEELIDRESFDDFDLSETIQEAIKESVLPGLTDLSPTPVQRLAIPAILGRGEGSTRRGVRKRNNRSGGQMEQFLLAAETGSGKTLAYALPIVDAIKRQEAVDLEEARATAHFEAAEERAMRANSVFSLPTPITEEEIADPARPKALVLLPTAELVTQVGAVFKSISHTVKFRTAMISSANSPTVIKNRLFSPGGVDVVISTPHLLSSITETHPNILSRVQHLVIDEADSLLDRSFSPTTSAIIDKASPSLKQLILCSATIPRSLDSYINKRYPDTWRLATPNLHAIPRRVQLTAIDIEKIPYQGNRDLACAQIIWDIGKEAVERAEDREKKIIVFVNERGTANSVARYLKEKGIDAYAFSRDSDQRQNDEILAAFTGTTIKPKKSPLSEETTETTPMEAADAQIRKLGRTRVLVTTDIASRGIDTTLVKHVILYDVPHTSIDFIHRLGRVGRMGRRGRGIVLVGRHDRKDIVAEVREGMFKGAALI